LSVCSRSRSSLPPIFSPLPKRKKNKTNNTTRINRITWAKHTDRQKKHVTKRKLWCTYSLVVIIFFFCAGQRRPKQVKPVFLPDILL
jgi:hypothetical protein